MDTNIIISLLLGFLVAFLFWLTLEPKYIIIKNNNNK